MVEGGIRPVLCGICVSDQFHSSNICQLNYVITGKAIDKGVLGGAEAPPKSIVIFKFLNTPKISQ